MNKILSLILFFSFMIELHIQPDVIHNTEQWCRTKEKNDVVTELIYNKEHTLKIRIDGWNNDKYTLNKVLDGKEKKVAVTRELQDNSKLA